MKYLFIYRHLLQFHNSQGYHSVQYNGKGTRLLSDEAHNKCIIIDLPSTTEQSLPLCLTDTAQTLAGVPALSDMRCTR